MRLNAYHLLTVAALSEIWPFESPDPIASADMAIERVRLLWPELWAAIEETTTPKAAASIMVDIMLSRLR